MLDAARLQGERLDLSLCARAVRDATTVLKPDGSLLLTYAPEALAPGLCTDAFEALKDLHPTSNTRGTAAGGRKRKAPSAVFGFLADDCWSPRCRMTSFTIENGAAYEDTLPLISAVSLKYKELAPTHWELQHRFATRVSPDFVIPGTVFSSVTFNRTWRTKAHTDSGNRRPGLEAMVVLTSGDIKGGELIFPRYRTAVDLAHGSLLLGDMHELHGNAPLFGPGLRLSLVHYMRAGISRCGTKVEEWAKRC
jgi:hypothetical protein